MTSYDPLKTVQFALAFPSVPKVEDTLALELLCAGLERQTSVGEV